MGKTINVEDFDTVITCNGPNKVTVYIDGKKIDGVMSITFTADTENVAETNIQRCSTVKRGNEEISVTTFGDQTEFKIEAGEYFDPKVKDKGEH